jgi:type I restriction enzyme M protein
VKIFPNEAFGYQRITVERPLRVRYTGEGARGRLEASKAFAKLADREWDRVEGALASLAGLSTTGRAEALAAADGKLSKAEERALLETLPVRDPEAPPLAGKGARPSPTPSCVTRRTCRSRPSR